AEDHLGTAFDGICGYSPKRSPRTFSRNELRNLLSSVGLQTIDEFFPFPDYKIPNSVVNLEFMEKAPHLVADVPTVKCYQNYHSQDRNRVFPDLLAMYSVADAKLLPEFSNSFLFLASFSDESPTRKSLLSKQANESGWYYNLDRKTPTRTAFLKGDK